MTDRSLLCPIIFSSFFLLVIASSCLTPSTKLRNSLTEFLSSDGLFSSHFVGFALYDPNSGKYLFQHQADKYFTPASNTKILTLLTALTYLGDSLATLSVHRSNDSTYIWPMGDPTFLHPQFTYAHPHQQRLLQHLSNTSKNVIICQNHFQTDRYGKGWAWDDYRYSYQIEKSSFPIFANQITFLVDSATQSIGYFPNGIEVSYLPGSHFDISRSEFANEFFVRVPKTLPQTRLEIPSYSAEKILASTLPQLMGGNIKFSKTCPAPLLDTIYYTTAVDTVFRRLMHQSDNFIAEQLLLQTSMKILGKMDTDSIIDFVKEGILAEFKEDLLWFDGSGLSRYNLFTPRAMVKVLEKIGSQIPKERLFDILATGGQSGTIKNHYGDDPPFVFAKTGTLRNRHCLSGFIATDNGRILIFSFMHNNYPGSSMPIKTSMERVLRFIKRSY